MLAEMVFQPQYNEDPLLLGMMMLIICLIMLVAVAITLAFLPGDGNAIADACRRDNDRVDRQRSNRKFDQGPQRDLRVLSGDLQRLSGDRDRSSVGLHRRLRREGRQSPR